MCVGWGGLLEGVLNQGGGSAEYLIFPAVTDMIIFFSKSSVHKQQHI